VACSSYGGDSGDKLTVVVVITVIDVALGTGKVTLITSALMEVRRMVK
ncbi:8529_t:CDS:2, partial [Gigaspora rosea]